MLTLNTIFHLASVVAIGVFAYFFLKSQNDIRTAKICLRSLVKNGKPEPIRILDRLKLIEFLGRFLNTRVEGEQFWSDVGLGKVDPAAILSLHLSHGVTLLRCKINTDTQISERTYKLEVGVQTPLATVANELRQRVGQAFGATVTVDIIESPSH